MSNQGKLNFKYTPEQIEIVKKIGSVNRSESLAAQEAVAAVLTEPVLKVIQTAPVIGNLFKGLTFEEGTAPSIPLDLYFDVRNRNFLNVWTQATAGGTASNFVQGISEMFINTHNLTSAVSLKKSYLRSGSIDHLAQTFEKIAEEVLVKQEIHAANVLLAAIAGGRIDGNAGNTAVGNLNVIRSYTAGRFQMDDFNTMMTRFERQLASNVGSTPVGTQAGITDIVGSPEFFAQVRSLAYQPVNTVSGKETTSGATSLAAPETLRQEIYRSAGIQSIFGINLIKCFDLGIGRAFNTLFSTYAGSTAYLGTAGTGSAAFAPTTEQLVIGLNANATNLVRLRKRGASGELTLAADDQYSNRSGLVGWYGEVEEGHAALDQRQMLGMLF
jgi:hypothetical protein